MTVTWLLAAVGLLLCGPGGQRVGDPPGRTGRVRGPLSLRTLQWAAGSAVAAACVVVLGTGTGTLAAAVAGPLSARLITHLHARPQRARASPALALALDLVAVALRAGQPLSAALVLAAPAVGGAGAVTLTRTGGLLRLGADPVDAWQEAAADPVLAPVAAAGRRSATSGARLADAFEQLAVEVRGQLRAEAEARAQRAAVFAAAPLGLCFLPSFVCLGIVPIVIGIAGAALGAT